MLSVLCFNSSVKDTSRCGTKHQEEAHLKSFGKGQMILRHIITRKSADLVNSYYQMTKEHVPMADDKSNYNPLLLL